MLSKRLIEAIDDGVTVPWDLHEAYGVSSFHGGRRREPKYTGLIGGRHDAAIGKGYVDLGLIDPARAKELGDQHMLDIIATHVATVLMKRDVAFIRDPEGIISSTHIDPKRIGARVISNLADHFGEEIAYASEREDQQAIMAYSKGEETMRRASIAIMPVTGKTGSGFKVIAKPSFKSVADKVAGAAM